MPLHSSLGNKSETLAQSTVAHTFNPCTLGGSLEARSSRPAWPTWQNPISTINTKTSWAWWQVPVVSATQEAEAGESLEPRKWRLQGAKMAPLFSTLGNRVRLHIKNEM